MFTLLNTLLIVLAALPIFFLVMPALTLLFSRVKGFKKSVPVHKGDINFGLIITCYKDALIALPLVDSLIKQSYTNWKVYVVADDCDASAFNFDDDRVIILSPAQKLGSKVKSILLAMDNYLEKHPFTVVFDPDNLAHPHFLAHLNSYHLKGYKVVQGQRTAKNLDTIYSCLDAMGELYYNATMRSIPFALGSSATIAGSGMSVETEKYQAIMRSALRQSEEKVIVGEDKILQSELVKSGFTIAYNASALVYDEKVATDNQVERQRARWINSYFKYFSYNKDLIFAGIKQLSFHKLLFAYNIIYPPMFLLVSASGFLMVLALFINLNISIAIFLSLVVFVLNFVVILYIQKAPRKVWLSLWGIPIFIIKLFRGLLKIQQSNKDFLTTQKVKYFTIEEVLEAENSGWNINPKPSITPKKILQVIRQGSFGGGETYLYNLVSSLNPDSYENIVLSFTGGAMIERLKADKVPFFVFDKSKFLGIGKAIDIYKLIRQEEIEIIHAHGTKAAFNALIPAKIAGIPIIYTVHGWSFHAGQNPIIHFLRKKIEGLLVSKATQTILVSESNLNDAKLLGFKGNFKAISNGVDVSKFNAETTIASSRAEFNLSDKDIIIASVARLTYQKAPQLLIKAFKKVSEQVPNARLLFVGGGELLEECKALVNSLSISDKVVFSSFKGEVAAVYKMVDYFVLPSYWEGFSLSLLEAMSMEKTIITSDYSSNAELIKNGENGYTFESGNETSLSEAILKAIENSHSNELLGKKAANIVRARYTFQRVVSDNILVYEQHSRKLKSISEISLSLQQLYKPQEYIQV